MNNAVKTQRIKCRTFRGVEYLNCDDYTEAEMEVIEDWENAPKDRRDVLIKKCGWEHKGLFEMSRRPT